MALAGGTLGALCSHRGASRALRGHHGVAVKVKQIGCRRQERVDFFVVNLRQVFGLAIARVPSGPCVFATFFVAAFCDELLPAPDSMADFVSPTRTGSRRLRSGSVPLSRYINNMCGARARAARRRS